MNRPLLVLAAAVAVIAALVVLGVAAVLSSSSLVVFGEAIGWHGRLAWCVPIMLDGAGVVGLVVWMAPGGTRKAREAAAWTGVSALVLSVAGNIAGHWLASTGQPAPLWLLIVASAIPPAVVFSVAHVIGLRILDREPANTEVAAGGPGDEQVCGPVADPESAAAVTRNLVRSESASGSASGSASESASEFADFFAVFLDGEKDGEKDGGKELARFTDRPTSVAAPVRGQVREPVSAPGAHRASRPSAGPVGRGDRLSADQYAEIAAAAYEAAQLAPEDVTAAWVREVTGCGKTTAHKLAPQLRERFADHGRDPHRELLDEPDETDVVSNVVAFANARH